MLIVVHRTREDDALCCSDYIVETVNRVFPDLAKRGRFYLNVTVGDSIKIMFCYGNHKDKMAGLSPNFWYCDNIDMANYLRDRASGVNGTQLRETSHILQVILYTCIWQKTHEIIPKKEEDDENEN